MNLSYKVRGQDIRLEPINQFEMDNGSIIAMYQGSRGKHPDIDFVVKYKSKNTRLRTPSHTHWIIDLVIKGEKNKNLTLDLVKEFINIYDEVKPFETQEERNNYNLSYTPKLSGRFEELNSETGLPIQMLLTLVELFAINEKRNEGAFMFRNMLTLCEQYFNGEKDYYQLVGISKRV